MLPSSARELTDDDRALVDLARSTIDENTDAGPEASGTHTMGCSRSRRRWSDVPAVNLFHFAGGPCAELVALATARANSARELTTIAAVDNHGRGPVGPCGRDRQVLFDYHPGIRVILPTEYGLRSALIIDLLPLAEPWTFDGGTEPHDPNLFEDR